MPAELDTAALSRHLGGVVETVESVAGGQSNPTWKITLDGVPYCLRKQPDGDILPSAHAVDREYRVMSALAGAGVPVPRTRLLEEDSSVIGTKFYIMEWIDGRVSNDSALPDLRPSERGAVFADAARVLARLHSVDWQAVGLGDYGRPAGYFARQIARWSKQWDLSRTRDDAHVDFLRRWLADRTPPEVPAAIVHGDFRIGNFLLHPTMPRIAAVLDWELSTIGDPMADLAHFACFYDLDRAHLSGLADADLAKLGIPAREDFIAVYRGHGGCDAPFTAFHRAFALFRFAVIFEGITARAKAGQASGRDAEMVGALAPVCAARAAEIAKGER